VLRTLLYTPSTNQMLQASNPSLIELHQSSPGSLLWVDWNGSEDADSEAILRQRFRFHPLAIDDALRETHVPKLDDWDVLPLSVHRQHHPPPPRRRTDTPSGKR